MSGQPYPGIDADVGVPAALNILSSTFATPIEVQTSTAHGLLSGATVDIKGHAVNTSANGEWAITITAADKFKLTGSVGVGVGGATGTVQSLGFNPDTFQIPVDGDDNKAATYDPGYEALGDRVAFLRRRLGKYRIVDVYSFDVQSLTAATWFDTTTTAAASWQDLSGSMTLDTTPVLVGDLLICSMNAWIAQLTSFLAWIPLRLSIRDRISGTIAGGASLMGGIGIASNWNTGGAGWQQGITLHGDFIAAAPMNNGHVMSLAAYGNAGSTFHFVGEGDAHAEVIHLRPAKYP